MTTLPPMANEAVRAVGGDVLRRQLLRPEDAPAAALRQQVEAPRAERGADTTKVKFTGLTRALGQL